VIGVTLKKIDLGRHRLIYSYSTSHLHGSQKVRFFYALKGRDQRPGLIEQTKSAFLAKGLILALAENEQLIDTFFTSWGCEFKKRRVAQPQPTNLIALKRLIEDLRLVRGKYVAIVQRKTPALRERLQSLLGNVVLKTSKELFRDQQLLDLFSREQSLLSETPITHTLFLYSSSQLSNSDKVRFFYALKGRNGPGALQQTKSEFLAKGVILTPITSSEAMQKLLTKYRLQVNKAEVSLENE